MDFRGGQIGVICPTLSMLKRLDLRYNTASILSPLYKLDLRVKGYLGEIAAGASFHSYLMNVSPENVS